LSLGSLTCTLRLEEEARSLSYYAEAHRVWPVNLDVISWLGAFHVRLARPPRVCNA
jgi:hypothetical protein